MAQSDLRNDLVNDELHNDAVKETPTFQNYSNSNQENEKVGTILKAAFTQVFTTKIVSFSQNGYSEEILKLSQH